MLYLGTVEVDLFASDNHKTILMMLMRTVLNTAIVDQVEGWVGLLLEWNFGNP